MFAVMVSEPVTESWTWHESALLSFTNVVVWYVHSDICRELSAAGHSYQSSLGFDDGRNSPLWQIVPQRDCCKGSDL